ncbi:LOW QUALITY PROTEIN: taste receptor type 1 member 3, partial [Spinachia spinachia]
TVFSLLLLLRVMCIMAAPFTLLVLCWAFRPSCSENPPQWYYNISTDLFHLPGDILLGGLFPINQLTSDLSHRTRPDNISCARINRLGLGLALVMKYAVDEINAQQILLPGIKLGFEIYDTCKQSSVVVHPTMSFLTAKSNKVLSVECDYTQYETSISAVIGPLSSEMVTVIGKLLGFFLMPQVSFGATSDQFSNKLLYPSFFRTVPSDKWQVEAMMLLLKRFKWNWVAVVGSEEEYGKAGVQEFSKLAENTSVCVAYQGLIPVYTDPKSAIDTIINNINATNVSVVVVFSIGDPAEVFFKEVIKRKVTAVWIGSTSWSMDHRLTSLPGIEGVGTIIGFIEKTKPLDLLPNYTRQLLTKLSKEGVRHKSNDLKDPCPQCWNLSTADITLVTQPSVKQQAFSVYAAIYSVAQALRNLLQCNSTACIYGPETQILPWKLLQVLKNTSVDINGKYLKFDSQGNPNIGYEIIEWVWKASDLKFIHVGSYYEQLITNKTLFKWHTANSEVPQSTCSAACSEGQVRRVKGFHSCCFDCIDCLEGTYQAKNGDIQCTQCPSRTWSVRRSTSCVQPTFSFLSWHKPEAVGLTLAVVLLLVCEISVGVLFLKHRGTPVITASGGALSFVAVLSLMGACLSLLLFLVEPGDFVCRIQVPLSSIFQTVALSIMTFISLQILYATEFPKMAASHLHVLRGPGTWLFVLVCCALQAGLCGSFVKNGVSLSEYMADMHIDFVTTFLACPMLPLSGLGLIQGFNCAMALVSFMCTFMAAKPLNQYNLARDITFSSLFYCVIWVTFIPIYTGLDVKEKSIAHVLFSLASNLTLVAAYYFPKCHLLLRKPELNTAEQFGTFLEGAPVTQAPEEPQPQSEKKT